MTGIYIIHNKVNNKKYIGQSCDIHRRWLEHLRAGQPDKYSGKSIRDTKTPIHRAMQKYGVGNFSLDTLEECSREELNVKEKYWIRFYKEQGFELYNLSEGGQDTVGAKGEHHSRAKLTQKEVNEIKRLLKETKKSYGEIKDLFPSIKSKSLISLINQGRNWRDDNEQYPIRPTDTRNIGEKSGMALFSNNEVMLIRKRYATEALTAADLAKEYNISASTMRAILRGASYKYLPYYNKSLNKWIEPCIDYPQSLK